MTTEFDLPEGFSEPGAMSEGVKFIKLKKADDLLKVRVLPPPASNKGQLGVFWAEHYGWMARNPKDPTKPLYKPVLCTFEKNKDGMTTCECVMCTYRKTYEDKRDDLKKTGPAKIEAKLKELKTAGKTDAEIKAYETKANEALQKALKDINDWLQAHNKDSKIRVFVMNDKEQLCVLSLPWGTFSKLRKAIEDASKLPDGRDRCYPGTSVKISPAGRKGLWFTIKREGRASKDSDSVFPCREVDGEGNERLMFHTLTDEQFAKMKESLPDLNKMKFANSIPEHKMIKLVELDKAGGGKADIDEVAKVFHEDVVYDETPINYDDSDVDFGAAPEPAKEEPKPVVEAAKPEPVKAEPAKVEPVKAPEPVKATAPVVEAPKVAEPTVTQPATSSDIDALFA